MIPNAPQAGMVLRYSFVWKHEAERGQDEGEKDRPLVVLVLLADGEDVVVAPLTTRPPEQSAPAIEVPARVRQNLGLDVEQSWISIATLNRFVWPGPDLRPTPGQPLASVAIGDLPDGFIRTVRAAAAAHLKGGLVKRSA
jgi:hypothetical protein